MAISSHLFLKPVALAAFPLVLAATNPFECDSGSDRLRRHFEAPSGIATGQGDNGHLYAWVADPGHFALRRIDLESRDVIEPRIPVGRPLSAVAAHLGPSGRVDRVWGIDRSRGEVIGIDTAAALEPTVSAVAFTDLGAPSNVSIDTVKVIEGRTATETWTVTYRESLDRWEVVGSGSGVQKKFAKTGDGYASDFKEVTFTIERTGNAPPTEGDRFEFTTDNGIQVALVSTGMALNLLALSNDVGIVTTDLPAVGAFSMETGLALNTLALPAGAIPAGMEAAPDGSAVWIADLGNALVHVVSTVGDPLTWTVTSYPAPVSMRDVAVSGDGLRVHAMAADADDVFLFEAATFSPVDFSANNPGFDPLSFPAAIRALSGARQAHVMKGSGVPSYPVLVTTHAGNVFVLNGATGCVDYADPIGARVTGVRYRDAATTSAPTFDAEVFETSRCGGVVRTETWTLTYNGLTNVWDVEGTASGKQATPMVECALYTTDLGELTLRIVGDPEAPTDDGDTYFLSVTDGISPLSIGLVPERPVFFTLTRDGLPIEYALISNGSSDTVTQIDVSRRRIVATYR